MRKSDLLLDDLNTDVEANYHNSSKDKKKRECFCTFAVIVSLLTLLACGYAVNHFWLPSSNVSEGVAASPEHFLGAPKLCDTCHMNPEVGGDYVLCESCGFEASEDKTLKCPKGYSNLFVTTAHFGFSQSAEIEGKIYTTCKKQMANGDDKCSVNVKQLVPDLKVHWDGKGPWDNKGPWEEKKAWMEKKEFGPWDTPFAELKARAERPWAHHRPPFFSAFDIFPMDAESIFELPTGPNEESLLDFATEEDQPILDALVEEPEVDSIEHLFLAIPHGHAPSIKLEKALTSCMQGGDKSTKTKPTCADGTTKLDCRGADKTNEFCVLREANKKAAIKYGPICSDGEYATCPDGFDSYKKNPKCLNNEMMKNGEIPTREKEICADGKKAKKCKKNQGHPKCQGKKKHKRFCPGGEKPVCPTGYSKGPCKSADGVRSKPKCADVNEKPTNCKKAKNTGKPECSKDGAQLTSPVCASDGLEPQCADGSVVDLNDYMVNVSETAQVFLSKSRKTNKGTTSIPSLFDEESEIFLSLPKGPNRESLLEHAEPEDQPIIDALIDTPEINSIQELWDAVPVEHIPSFKLAKALVSCMKDGDKSTKVKPECADGETKLGKADCKGLVEGDAGYDACLKKKADNKAGTREKYMRMCSDGQYAICPEGFQSYKKNPKCVANDVDATPSRTAEVCADGSKVMKCKKDPTNAKCVGKKDSKTFCVDESKPTCPDGYSKGACKSITDGSRTKEVCPDGKRPTNCKKDKHGDKPECNDENGRRMVKTCKTEVDALVEPSCPDGFELDMSDYIVDLTPAETSELFLSAMRGPRRGGPPGGRGGPPKPCEGDARPERCESGEEPVCPDGTARKDGQKRGPCFDADGMPAVPLCGDVPVKCSDGADIKLYCPIDKIVCENGETAQCPSGSSVPEHVLKNNPDKAAKIPFCKPDERGAEPMLKTCGDDGTVVECSDPSFNLPPPPTKGRGPPGMKRDWGAAPEFQLSQFGPPRRGPPRGEEERGHFHHPHQPRPDGESMVKVEFMCLKVDLS